MNNKLADLKEIIEKGEEFYKQGTSYEEWYDSMISQFGASVRPHLREAWKHLQNKTRPGEEKNFTSEQFKQESGNRFFGCGNFVTALVTSMKTLDRRAFIAGLACGLIMGAVLFYLLFPSTHKQRFIVTKTVGPSPSKWIRLRDEHGNWILNMALKH